MLWEELGSIHSACPLHGAGEDFNEILSSKERSTSNFDFEATRELFTLFTVLIDLLCQDEFHLVEGMGGI